MSNVLDYRFFDMENNCYVENKAAFCICQGKVCETLSGHFEEEKSVIAEQSTGLKDKNGKIIYEGDIVRFKISTIKCIGAVRRDKNTGGWLKDNCGNPLYTYIKTIEVAGNIHENSDLFEVKL